MFLVLLFPLTSIYCTTKNQRTPLKKDDYNGGWDGEDTEKPGPESTSADIYHAWSVFMSVYVYLYIANLSKIYVECIPRSEITVSKDMSLFLIQLSSKETKKLL